MKTDIALLVCGGTLDKDYDPLKGELTFSETHLPQLLSQAHHQLALRLDVVMLKDSLDMDQQDRRNLYQACLDAPESQLVITHGTDTLSESARFLFQQAEQLAEKTIVLTGAMRPFRLGDSDASFNLGAALMAVQISRPGIYVCMNGRLFNGHQVQKNRQRGLFEALN